MNFKDKILSRLCDQVSNEIIYGMWMGEDLSLIEQLSILSFLKNGHKYVLYTYGDIKNIPENVEVRDGNEILNESNILKTSASLTAGKKRSTFANWFRYILLYKYGGWWADLDIVCLKHLDFKYPYVFSSHHEVDCYGNNLVNNCIIKSHSQASIFKFYSELCEENITEVVYGETGPILFYYIIKKYGLTSYIYPLEFFEPSFNINVFKKDTTILPNTHTIHLNNQKLVNKVDKNKIYDSDSLIGKLQREYLDVE
jgi:hypothetical protein